MLKRVPVGELRPGMFIVDLSVGWLAHPFVRNKFHVCADDILRIRDAGIQEVVVDLEKSRPQADEQLLADNDSSSDRPLASTAAETPHRVRAQAILADVMSSVAGLVEDIRFGRALDIGVLDDLAHQIATEVADSPSLILLLHQMRANHGYVYSHSVAVSVLSTACARYIGQPDAYCKDVALGGLIHDVGMLCMPTALLAHNGVMSDEQKAQVRAHVMYGQDLLKSQSLPPVAMSMLLEHHERFDGAGYPLGTAGADISLAGKIAAIADVFDAISSDRGYHDALPPAAAIRKIHELSGRCFDPLVAAGFIRAIGIYPVGSLVRLSNNRLAVIVEHRRDQPLSPKVLPVIDLQTNARLSNVAEIDLAVRRHITIDAIEDPVPWGIDPYAVAWAA